MSNVKGPFDPEDTDWGKKYERRHNDYTARFNTIEDELEELKSQQKEMAKDLNLNNVLTNQIKTDTTAIVALFNGSKVMAAVIKYLIGVAVGFIALWTWIKVK